MIIDSRLTFADAIAGTKAPPEVVRDLCLLTVQYVSFDGKGHEGQVVINRALRAELAALFLIIGEMRFPLARVMPIVQYGWSDTASMEDNNSSAFNYRCIAGTTRMSLHGRGLALDLNPRQNPVVYADGTILPHGAMYDMSREGTLGATGGIVQAFRDRGWRWGGDFTDFKDYHHFEKITPVVPGGGKSVRCGD